MKFILYSSRYFERWDYNTPDTTGIGGSETAHIELAWRLARRGHEVVSYAPIHPDTDPNWRGTVWKDCDNPDASEDGIWIIFRLPQAIDLLPPGTRAWLICQDTHYPDATDEQVGRFEHVIGLCEDHIKHLEHVYPSCRGKTWQLSNGVRSDLIRTIEAEGIDRDPQRLVYASSIDRGLENLMHIFKRAKDWNSNLKLDCYYGTHNLDKLAKNYKRLATAKENVEKLAQQRNVTMHGRVSQPNLIRAWFGAGIFDYPTSFTETSPVHGDTMVETLSGPKPIKTLAGKSGFHVWSCNSNGGIAYSKVKWCGMTRSDTEVLKITCVPGIGRNAKKAKELTLTPDHEVMLADGTYRAAGMLKVGDRVKALHKQPDGFGAGYATIGLTGGNMVPAHRFVASVASGVVLKDGQVVDHKDGDTTNNEPDNLNILESQAIHAARHYTDMPEENKMAMAIMFLNNTKHSDKSAAAKANWSRVNALPPEERKSLMLERARKRDSIKLAASNRLRSEKYRKSLDRWDEDKLRELYLDKRESTVSIGKMFGVSATCISYALSKLGIPARNASECQLAKRSLSNHTITKIEHAGYADVYCMEVEPHHNFCANGIVVHNCVSVMEAQACGAFPIVTPLWGLKDNTKFGSFICGNPDHDPLTRSRHTMEILRVATDNLPQISDGTYRPFRDHMMTWTRMQRDWDRIVDMIDHRIYGWGDRGSTGQYNFQLRNLPGKQFANVGCDVDSPRLANLGAVNIDMLDFNPAMKWKTAAHVIADVRQTAPPELVGKMDGAVLGDILEHMTDEEAVAVLKNVKKLRKNGGNIVITVPDDRRGWSQHAGLTEIGYKGHSPVPRKRLDGWLEAAELRTTKYQQLEYGFAEGHGVVCC